MNIQTPTTAHRPYSTQSRTRLDSQARSRSRVRATASSAVKADCRASVPAQTMRGRKARTRPAAMPVVGEPSLRPMMVVPAHASPTARADGIRMAISENPNTEVQKCMKR